jgi:type I restriction enzyme S subunit
MLTIKYGKGLETTKLTSTGYPVFGSNGIIGFYTKYMYEKPQVLISCRGASSGVVNISLPYSFITSNSLICERTNPNLLTFEYLKYYFLNSNLVQYQTGSAQPQITINNIEKLKFVVPNIELQEEFARLVRRIDDKILTLQLQSANLTRQRDLLLPRLMSGQLTPLTNQ